MDTADKADDAPPSSIPNLIFLMSLSALLTGGSVYFAAELFDSPRAEDFLFAILFFVSGSCLCVSQFFQWRRSHRATSRSYYRSHPASFIEKIAQIIGLFSLSAGSLIPTRLLTSQSRLPTGNYPFALILGFFTAVCLLAFLSGRRRSKSSPQEP